MKNALSIALGVMVLASCTRQSLPDPVVALPEFSAKFTLDGVESEIAAGVNDFYLEPSFHENSTGVLEYVATFRKPNGDPTALEVIIQDDEWRLPVTPVQPDLALLPGTYQLQDQEIELNPAELRFCSFAGTSGTTYSWLINGVEYSTPFPNVAIEPGEALSAKLLVSHNSGCTDSLTQVCETFDASGTYANYYYESFSWKPTSVEGQIHFAYDGNPEKTSEIRWDIIDGTNTVVEYGEQVWHSFSNEGPHRVTLSVELTNGHTFKYSDRVSYDALPHCLANVHFLSPPLTEPETSRVRIAYTDPNGERYESYSPGLTQPVNGSFEIVGMEDYTYTVPGSTESVLARRLEVAFSCTLYNVDDPSDFIEIQGFEGTVAVSFPQ